MPLTQIDYVNHHLPFLVAYHTFEVFFKMYIYYVEITHTLIIYVHDSGELTLNYLA